MVSPDYATCAANLQDEVSTCSGYTAGGDLEAGRSELERVFYRTRTAVDWINDWLASPFHAIGMLRAPLTQVAFATAPGLSADDTWGALDVTGGLNGPAASGPVLFPGDGMTTDLTTGSYVRGPDVQETCGWNRTVGLPLFALLPTSPAPGLTATLTSAIGQSSSTAAGSLCTVDENNYVSSDATYGPVGKQILQRDHAVVLVPANPLLPGRYTATINQPGTSPISWSFVVAPLMLHPYPAYVVHVANGGARTVLGNLTSVGQQTNGYLTVWPCDEARPNASNLNFQIGDTVANFAAVRPDPNGDICVGGPVRSSFIWDQTAETNLFAAHAPQRLLDTRKTGQRLATGQTLMLHVAAPGTATVLGNLTVVTPSAKGYATAYPCGSAPPNASNVNFTPVPAIANFAAVNPNADGDICFYVNAAADLLWDQVAETNSIVTAAPHRVLDTRRGGTKLAAGVPVKVHVAAPGTTAVLGNSTVTHPDRGGYVVAYPCGAAVPRTSNINFSAGRTVANFAVIRPDAHGDICFRSTSSTDLIWDQVASSTTLDTHSPVRLQDTRHTGPSAY